MSILSEITKNSAALTAIRRDLHQHPELAFEEERTSNRVAELLTQWGIPVFRNIAKTGLVGLIEGNLSNSKKCSGGKKQPCRMLGLRADMDALPMQEENKFTHASRVAGKMHACGHDGHTTMLLGAAQYLARHRDFEGSVAIIFQPAEEFGGGARVMLEEGLLERFPIQAVFGMHNLPGIAQGSFALSPGPILASNSEFKLKIIGAGGHAAMPHMTVDPIIVSTHIVQALQSIISRNKPPLESAVLSVTTIASGDTFNVIADTCDLRGTVRAYSKKTLDLIEQRMQALAQNICEAFGARCEFIFNKIYPATINHVNETTFAQSVLLDLVGREKLVVQKPIMAAEDFSFMLEKIPGCYAFIGNGDGSHRFAGHGNGPCHVHNVCYDFNDAILPLGASYFVTLAQRWLAQDSLE